MYELTQEWAKGPNPTKLEGQKIKINPIMVVS